MYYCNACGQSRPVKQFTIQLNKRQYERYCRRPHRFMPLTTRMTILAKALLSQTFNALICRRCEQKGILNPFPRKKHNPGWDTPKKKGAKK